jgi:HK97 family phage prohead protease
MNRAYTLLKLKSVDEGAREFTGLATTPEVDSVGDIVEPMGAKFKLPIPLLLGHDASKPIGHVTAAKVTSKGIEVKAKILQSDAPGTVKDRLDEAWHSIKLGLVRGLSIGFSPVPGKSKPLKSGGMRFVEWLWHELSAVTIPANQGATITAVKAAARRGVKRSGTVKSRKSGSVYLGDKPGSMRAPVKVVRL